MKARLLPIASLVAGSLIACAEAESGTGANEAAQTAAGTVFDCTPIDGDEACGDAKGCVQKMTVTTTAGGASLTLALETQDRKPSSQVLADALSFTLRGKTLMGAWSDGDVRLSTTKVGPGERYQGTASVDGIGSFGVDCKLAGSPDLPLFVRSAKPFEECNGKNASGQIIRCLKGATCTDEDGDEIAVLQHKKGVCVPSILHTAKRGDACNVNPAGSVALIECERGAGLHCKDPRGEEIPLAQSSQAGTCL